MGYLVLLRIATWNLERATTAQKRLDAQERMAEWDADIWVLTESRDDVVPRGQFRAIARSALRPGGSRDERWVTIWTRVEDADAASLPTQDSEFTACATFPGMPRGPLTVYGTVLPWSGSIWRGYPSAGAVAYGAAIDVQAIDWRELGERGEVCVAGDFNQDLVDRHYYWSGAAREHLARALNASQLTAATGGDTDPVRRLTDGAAACIDHICLSPSLNSRLASPPIAWASERGGRRISDHPGVMVVLADA